MRFLTALRYLIYMLLGGGIYAAALYLSFKWGWTTEAVRALHRYLLELGFTESEALNLSVDVSGALFQVLTLGLLLSAGGLFLRTIDQRKRQSFIAKSILTDYQQILRTLEAVQNLSPIKEPDSKFLRFLLDALERQIRRLEGRVGQFGDFVDPKATYEFERLVQALDNILSFIMRVRNWNERVDSRTPPGFFIPGQVLSDTSGTPEDIETFHFVHDHMMSFLRRLKQRPSRRAKKKLKARIDALEDVRESFLEVKSRDSGNMSAVA